MSAYGLARTWWVILLRGLGAVVFGAAAFIWPTLTLMVLGVLFGAYLLVDGSLAVIAGLPRSNGSHQPWWLLLIEGLIGFLAGGVIFFLPSLTIIAVLYLIAAWAIITGFVEIVSAIRLLHAEDIQNEGLLALSGILSVVLGMRLLVVWTGATALGLVWMMGVYALVFGLLLIGLSLGLWGWQKATGLRGLQLAPALISSRAEVFTDRRLAQKEKTK
jgi:uncharacterized membrane protein HdeD (DUF308 family)